MKQPTKNIFIFMAGVAAMFIFTHLMNERQLRENRFAVDACAFVSEEYNKISILSYAGYWKSEDPVCLIFENEKFRKLNNKESVAYEASLETRAGY